MKEYICKKKFILLIVLISFLSAPVHITHADFNDSTSQLANLKLELGNIDLSFSDSNQSNTEEHVIEANNQPLSFKVPEIKNSGSLDGKLFFKVDIYQVKAGKEEHLTEDSSSSNFKVNIKAGNKEHQVTTSMNDYQPIANQDRTPLVLSSQDASSINFSIDSFNISNVDEYKVKFTFLLTQTNGTIINPLFHDTVEMTYHFEVDKDSKDPFWNGLPVEEVKNLGYKYALELPRTFNFSSLYRYVNINGNIHEEYYHQSFNWGTLYLESKERIESEDWNRIISFNGSDMDFFDVEKVTDNRMKIRFIMKHDVLKGHWYRDKRHYNKQTIMTLRKNRATYSIQFDYTALRNNFWVFTNTRNDFIQSNTTASLKNEVVSKEPSDQGEKVEETLPLPDKKEPILEESEDIEKETSPDQAEETSEPNKDVDESKFPFNEKFKYIDIKLDDDIYNIGITQEQFDGLLRFATLEEFGKQITKETPALYVKYDKVTGIENIERFVYDLAEQKQIDFDITLENHPEEKILEITFTK